MRRVSGWPWRVMVLSTLVLGTFLPSLAADRTSEVPQTVAVVTNLVQLHDLASRQWRLFCTVRLTGVVCAVGPVKHLLALQDDSGVELLELSASPELPEPGHRVILEGQPCEVVRRPSCIELRAVPVVDHDGMHGMSEKVGRAYLKPGRQPLRLDWFNAAGAYGLEVAYEGPGVPRQRVPNGVLVRECREPAAARTNPASGLVWRDYEGQWSGLPDFSQLAPVKTGTTTNFGLGLVTRAQNVGLQFTGYLEILREGLYTFYVRSDDGSRLWVGEAIPRITLLTPGPVPVPRRVEIGRVWEEGKESDWASVEGTVAFVSEQSDHLDLELKTGTDRLRVAVAETGNLSPALLLHSRIRAVGVCQSSYSVDGRKRAGRLRLASWREIEPLELPPEVWNLYPVTPIEQLTRKDFPTTRDGLVRVAGRVRAVGPDRLLSVRDSTGEVLVRTLQPLPAKTGGAVEVLGRRTLAGTEVVMEVGVYRELKEEEKMERRLPLLTLAEQVQRLTREEAERGYPVILRGVITCNNFYQGVVIQDTTRGTFLELSEPLGAGAPQAGEFWEVQGVTGAGLFSPMVRVKARTFVGEGRLPEPVHPTWDQLMNGSMDTQYAEVQGIVTRISTNALTLLTHGGKIQVGVTGVDPRALPQFENTLVRIRGCLLAVWDATTHQVKVGEVTIGSASINADEPMLADPFIAPAKSTRDLLLFDLRAGAFQRVKVRGQIVHRRGAEYYLMDGTNGVRLVTKNAPRLQVGDLAEAAGINELGGPSPVLREALTRKLGHAMLPEARRLLPEDLLRAEYDSTLVCVEALLVELRTRGAEQILELQAGLRRFVARLDSRTMLDLEAGSRLELTGVYAGQGNSAPGEGIDSFELLLNSPADVRVLARPAWWTLPRLLGILGVMMVILLGAVAWAWTLRRQVVAQTKIIRQKVERESILEERTRIARELHDTLEQALAGISLQLNALAGALRGTSADALHILEIARAMVRHGQEEARRTVRNLRLLALEKSDLPAALSQIASTTSAALPGGIRVSVTGIASPLPPKVESHLLRIAQEATTNALKHARANTVRLELHYKPESVQLCIQDDGCGFGVEQSVPSAEGHFGLLGMRERAEKVNGVLRLTSAPGAGTTVQVTVPLSPTGDGAADNQTGSDPRQ